MDRTKIQGPLPKRGLGRWFRTSLADTFSRQLVGRPRPLRMEPLEERRLMATLPLGAFPNDTGEYMLGRVAVTPVLMESNGNTDPNLLDWTPQQKADVLANIQQGLNWWTQLLSTKSTVHQLEWVIDTTYVDAPVPTAYEPITRRSNDYALWVPEFLSHVAAPQGDIETRIRHFNHSQRTRLETDWSFTIFVVNSAPDQIFASGGSFTRAFAFAGGLFFVTPSNRPASTYTHETGHMFWARDEYAGGGNYFQRRGYYDSQNLNAVDLNPTPGFQPQPSIMGAGTNLEAAYTNRVTAQATLAQIGWQDSDQDGIFDVLDVPLELVGTGEWLSGSQEYAFRGSAKAVPLSNRNSSGLQNDITLNRVGRIEYRFNGTGAWTTIASPDAYQTQLDLRIPVPSGVIGTIDIRAIDPRTGITSSTYRGDLAGYDMTAVRGGISGFVWLDVSSDGNRQPGEGGLPGWEVQLVDAQGAAVDLQNEIEPDAAPLGMLAAGFYPGVTLRAVGGLADGTLGIATHPRATTGTQVFVPYDPFSQQLLNGWRDDDQSLEARFAAAQGTVSVDVIGLGDNSFARLEAYSATGQILERVTSNPLASGQATTLTLSRPSPDIAYVLVRGHLGTRIGIDHLRYGTAGRVVTGSAGEYRFSGLLPGTYYVKAVAPSGFEPAQPSNGMRSATVTANVATDQVNLGFGRTGSPWQNPFIATDVNNSATVEPIDVLQVINALRRSGSTELSGNPIPQHPYIDVNGDRLLSPIDALIVINQLQRQLRANGEGGSDPSTFLISSGIPREPADGEPAMPWEEPYYLGDEGEPSVADERPVLVQDPPRNPIAPPPALPSAVPSLPDASTWSRRRFLSSHREPLSAAVVDRLMSDFA